MGSRDKIGDSIAETVARLNGSVAAADAAAKVEETAVDRDHLIRRETNSLRRARRLLTHYFELALVGNPGVRWESDLRVEIEEIADAIVDAAVAATQVELYDRARRASNLQAAISTEFMGPEQQ